MVKPLDVFLRDVASPQLRSRGFRRSGRSFVLPTGPGDGGLIRFQEFRLGRHEVECFVNLAVIFGRVRDWLYRGEDPPAHWTEADGLWRTRLWVPGKHWMAVEQLWEFNLSDEQMTDTFKFALTGVLDRLRYLADPRQYAQRSQAEQFPQGRVRVLTASVRHCAAVDRSRPQPGIRCVAD